MHPQQFNTDFYTTTYAYAGRFPPNTEPGPSTSTSLSPPGQSVPSNDGESIVHKRQRSAPRLKRKRGSSVADDNADNSPGSGSGSGQGTQRTMPKKKKANRACFHCQKAHLTCDDSRPCQRCIKRGLADKCTEGLRKKAKYLLDEEELAALKQQQKRKSCEESDPGNEHSCPPPSLPPQRQHLDASSNPPPTSDPDPLFNLAFDPTYAFGSEAANLEYSILSAILGNPSPPNENSSLHSRPHPDRQSSSSSVNDVYPQFANQGWPAPSPNDPPPTSSPTITPAFLHQPPLGQPPASFVDPNSYHPPLSQSQSFSSVPSSFPPPSSPPSAPQAQNTNDTIHQPQAHMHFSQPSWTGPNSGPPSAIELSRRAGHDISYLRTTGQGLPYRTANETRPQNPSPSQGLAPLSPPPSNSSPGTPLGDSSFHFHLAGEGEPAQTQQQQLQERRRVGPVRKPQLHQTAAWGFSGASTTSTSANTRDYAGAGAMPDFSSEIPDSITGPSVYEAVTKRYDYTQGYHYLMRHLHARFDKNDILRVVRALAIVRPSLIALQMPLTEEDEVFVEKCFQRSLLEMNKLISFGGTPTVVWRRTGEICLVGFEFTMLTGWTREELLGRCKYIYELFENQSTVEYFEKFAAHAFENTTQSVISHCVLLKPSGAPVPCAFCFSIRRDLFDLPNLIIGQWLPLL